MGDLPPLGTGALVYTRGVKESCLRSFRLPRCEHTLCQLCRGKRTGGDDFGALVPFQLDPARGSAQRACDWLWGGLVENLVQIVGTALDKPGGRRRLNAFTFQRAPGVVAAEVLPAPLEPPDHMQLA